jgi:DedD protein
VVGNGASAPAEARASDAQAGRFVVQVGAYTDAAALREARQKVEKLGMKTYTQVIETEAGKRTRVRVGPFATREEATAAGRALKAAGLPANILAL